MRWIDQRGSEVLDRNECLRLLAMHAGGVGRVGFTDGSRVAIEPVNYRMYEKDLVIQIGPGSIMAATDPPSVVSFEVDGVTPHEAFSVLVRGLASIPSERVAALARPRHASPLVPEPGTVYAMIRTDTVTGRRFAVRTPEVTPGDGTVVGDLHLGPAVVVGRDASIREAAAAMEEHGTTSVILGQQPAWLLSEHDLVGGLAAGLRPDDAAGDLATRTPLWVTTTTPATDAAAMLAKHCVPHLLVLHPDGTTAGVLSGRDLLRQLMRERSGVRRS
jgi:CBS domain-containing protein